MSFSGSEGEPEEEEEVFQKVFDKGVEEEEAEEKREGKKESTRKPKTVKTDEEEEEKAPSSQGDPDVNEFTQLGYVWEFNKKTQEYRAARLDKKGSERIKGAPIKGRLLWQKVTDCYRKHGVWFSEGKELDEYLTKKDNERIDEEVNRRLEERDGQKGRTKAQAPKEKAGRTATPGGPPTTAGGTTTATTRTTGGKHQKSSGSSSGRQKERSPERSPKASGRSDPKKGMIDKVKQ